jgi:lysophospholipase L1-like esterase
MMPTLFFASAFTALFSCTKKTAGIGLPVAAGSVKTYLALGDSYTIGQSVAVEGRFPSQTVALLRQGGLRVADPVYIAQTGWTTANLQHAITTQNPAPTYDMVSLLIGVNDQYQSGDTSGYALRFTQLLEKAIMLARGKKERVFVLSIPDYSVTPFVPAAGKERVSKEIDAFNAINFRITTAYGVSYTNITPSSREGATNADLIAADGLHPSALEYKKWAEQLAPKIRAALQ